MNETAHSAPLPGLLPKKIPGVGQKEATGNKQIKALRSYLRKKAPGSCLRKQLLRASLRQPLATSCLKQECDQSKQWFSAHLQSTGLYPDIVQECLIATGVVGEWCTEVIRTAHKQQKHETMLGSSQRALRKEVWGSSMQRLSALHRTAEARLSKGGQTLKRRQSSQKEAPKLRSACDSLGRACMCACVYVRVYELQQRIVHRTSTGGGPFGCSLEQFTSKV
eukprot:scaffold125809_cov19-Tisochrysis_lutea.AAC.1